VTQVEGARDVGRWNYHGELFQVWVLQNFLLVGVEELLLLPPCIPSCLYLLRDVLVCHWLRHIFLLSDWSIIGNKCLLLLLLLNSASSSRLYLLAGFGTLIFCCQTSSRTRTTISSGSWQRLSRSDLRDPGSLGPVAHLHLK
jgi:hypothetical protein